MRVVASAIVFVSRGVSAGLAGLAMDGLIGEGTYMFTKDYLLPLLFKD